MTNIDPRKHLPGVPDEAARHSWGSMVAFGLICTLLGLLALVLTETATIASVVVIGVLMMLAGIVEIGIGLRTRSWGRLVLWELAGALYLLAGLFAVALPALASVYLTLMLGAGLLATGLLRIFVGARVRGSRSRGGVALAGAVTALVGLMVVLGWPNNSFLILGTFLGIDLMFYGLTWLFFGFRIRAQQS